MAWVFAVLCVILILRAAALGDRDNAQRFAEWREAAAEEPRPHEPVAANAAKTPRPHEPVAVEAAEQPRPREPVAEKPRPREPVAVEAAEKPRPRAPVAAKAGDKPRRRVPGRHAGALGLLITAGLLAGAAVDAPDASARCDGAPEDVTLCLVNAERRSRGRAALAVDRRLALAARRYSADMVARGFFAHVSPDGAALADRLQLVGYTGGCAWSAGETLAWGFGDQQSPASRVAAWMNSRRHRRVLLGRRYRDVGIGVAHGVPTGGQDGLTYTAELGRRRC